MPLPRRCKKCRCYVAPQLKRCPRCKKIAPSVDASKPTKEERAEERVKRDAHLPVIHQKNMQWAPSAFSVKIARTALAHELPRMLDKAPTPRARNAVRAEIRLAKAKVARAKTINARRRWVTEFFHGKYYSATVFVSPKGHRYVLATRDGPADLLIQNRKRVGIPFTRLVRFEKSRYARMAKADKKDEVIHKKRKKAKKEKRAKKRDRTTE